MNVKHVAKLVVNHTLRPFGWKLQRSTDPLDNFNAKKKLHFIEDPMEALLLSQFGEKVAFKCPVELCRFESGFGFAQNEWHPFVATLKQYEKNQNLEYKDPVLKQL